MATWRSWTEFYANRLERFQRMGVGRPINPVCYAGAERHVELLQRQELDPNDNFLENGCGIMRIAAHLSKYLEPNHYVGVERRIGQ